MTTLTPYPAYKNSGIEWLGEIPGHWSRAALRHLGTKFGSGLTPRGGATTYVSNGVLFLRSQNVHFDGLRLDDVAHISDEVDEGMANSRVRVGDVLLNITGASIGRCSVVPEGIGRANVNQHVCVIRPDQTKADPKFLHNYLRSEPIQVLIQQVSTGAAREGLTLDEMKTFPVSLPPLDEQRAIAAFLDAMDARITRFISARKKMIRLLGEKKQAVINQAVTKGLDPTVPMKDSGVDWLGEIPAHWEVRRGGTLFAERNETGFPDLPILEVSLVTGVNVRDLDDPSRKQMMSDRSGYKKALEGDLPYNMMRMWQGAVGIAPVDGLVSPAYVVLRPRAGTVGEFYGRLFRTEAFMGEVKRHSRGIVSDRDRLYWEDFKQLHLPYPPPAEQKAIAEFLQRESDRLGAIGDRARREIQLIQEYRTRLISDVVTGKLDVRGVDLSELPEFDEIPNYDEIGELNDDNKHV